MLDAASYPAFWRIFDETGIRPEWLLPVLFHESGFNPAIPNGQGAPYYGLGQNSPADIQRYAGVDVSTYLTWPASAQLNTVVLGYFKALVAQYGPLNSGARVYQAEFLPATLKTATGWDDVIAGANGPYASFYAANQSLDPNRTGQITLRSLAELVTKMAAAPAVQAAIQNAYAGRLDSPTDPAYGTGGSAAPGLKTLLTAVAILGSAWVAATYLTQGPAPFRKMLRAFV